MSTMKGKKSAKRARPTTTEAVIHVALDELSGDNVRTPSKEGMEELVRSVREVGVLAPILVQKEGAGYRVLDGFRRAAAARTAKLRDIRAVVVDSADGSGVGGLEVSLIANLQREDMPALDEARGIQQLVERTGWTQGKVAELLGKSGAYVSAKLKLLELDPKILTQVQEGKISESHAEVIARAPKQIQHSLARDSTSYEWSVRRLEQNASWKADRFREAQHEKEILTKARTRSKFGTCPYPVDGKPCGAAPARFDYGSRDFVTHRNDHTWSLKTGKLRYPVSQDAGDSREPREPAKAPALPTLPEVTPEVAFAPSPGDLLDVATAGSPKVHGVLIGQRKGRTDVYVRLELARELVPGVPWFVVGDFDGGGASDLADIPSTRPGKAHMGGCDSWDQQTDGSRKKLAETKAALQAWGDKMAGSPRGKKED